MNNDPIKRESQSCYHRQHRHRQAARLACGHIPLHCHLLRKLGTTRYQEFCYRGPLLTRLAKYHHQILDIKCRNISTLHHEDSTHKTTSNEPHISSFSQILFAPSRPNAELEVVVSLAGRRRAERDKCVIENQTC